jgi:hypothetical protein
LSSLCAAAVAIAAVLFGGRDSDVLAVTTSGSRTYVATHAHRRALLIGDAFVPQEH